MQVIYADTLFFLNAAVNYLLLLGTGRFSGYPYKRWRLLISSLIGAAYAVAACIPDLDFLNSFWCKALSSVLMVFAGFGFESLRSFGKRLVLFLLVSVVFGGAVLAAHIAEGGAPASFATGTLYTKISLKVLVISVAVSYGIVSIFFRGAGRHGAFSRETVKVTVRYEGRVIVFTALIDSGNTLLDPVSGNRVIVAETEAVKDIMPSEIRGLFDIDSVGDPAELMRMLASTRHAVRFRMIPFRTVGTGSGLLIAFRPDRVEVGGKVKKGMLIALSPNQISEGAGYCALV